MMRFDREELDRRLAAADRARLTLRRATLEWRALGEQLLRSRERNGERGDRPPRSDGGASGGDPGAA